MKFDNYVFAVVINSLVLFRTSATTEVLKVYEDFFTDEDFDLIQRNSEERSKEYQYDWSENLRLRASILSSHQAMRMLDTIGVEPVAPVKEKFIVLKELTAGGEPTVPHVDSTYNEDGEIVGIDSDVAFIFANTNPDASFVFHHGNLEGSDLEFVQEVPVKKGSLVVFPGGTHYHKADIKSGKVHLVGPFMPPTFKMVQGRRALSEDLQYKEERVAEMQEIERSLKSKGPKAPKTPKASKAPKAPGKGKGETIGPTDNPTPEPTPEPSPVPRRRALNHWMEAGLHLDVEE